ncbi:hypothetical protein BGZ97_009780 [Linnemannia gamsii]|jgi:hypothetical protein|uniref:Uncharacterized protein n=1 Tax=Linnemannia gamsii TaxID=64522 RepID=A0A9P6QN61_9FUNG|nr:hypothetical protein BGZ97_009780 [Linnemannia gamsii]
MSFSPTAAQSVAQENDYDSDDIYDDDDDDNDEDDDNYNNNEESRGGKRVRHSTTTNTNAHQDPNQTLPQNFRAQKKNGIIQYEIWIVAFFKPQLLTVPPALATVGGVQLEGYSHWTEILNALLDSVELQQFVRAEVSGGRIGIDFKEIMARKKDKRKSTRRVVR